VVFDRRVARSLRAGESAVVGSYGASMQSFRRCKRARMLCLLDYPISHHRWSREILAEEAEREPEFAETLQYHRFTPSEEAQLDEEIQLANQILVLSTFQKRTFVEAGVDEVKLSVVPLGVDLDLFQPRPRAPDDDVFRIIFVGQITQRKGLSYLLKGFERAAIPNTELLLVGKPVGSTKSWALRPGVRHKAHEPRARLPEIYRNADVMVLPSIVEGFGLTALEAMASGLPVIVSENTFGSDVITDGVDGYVVPIRDADAIAERFRTLWSDRSLRSTIGDAARRRAETFSWEAYGRRGVEVIRDALARRDLQLA